MNTVNLERAFASFDTAWEPHIVGELNGQSVKVAKFRGEFVWHHHAGEDEMFLVVRGHLRMQFRDRTVDVRAGEFLVVPRGVEHCPLAVEECHVVLFEPTTTLNTGNVRDEHTVEKPPRL